MVGREQLLGDHDRVIKQEIAWATLGGMATRPLSLRCPPQATGSTTLLLGRNSYDHLPVHVRLPPARRWRRDREGTLHVQDGTMLRYVGQ